MNAKVKNAGYFIERRRKKRCPQCQFFAAFILIVVSSFAVSFLFDALPGLINKGDFQVVSASSFESKKSIVIDADLKMNFPDDVVEALENGIPITVAVEVQVLRERPWWRDVIIKESTQRFELRYHPLTNVHEVKNIATDERYTFNSRQDAMAVLGTIRGAHLIEKKELGFNTDNSLLNKSKKNQYYIQMRILLDISRLPPALRQIASLSSAWRLESAWFRWEIDDKPRTQMATTEVDHFNLSVALKKENEEPQDIPVPEPVSDDVADYSGDNTADDSADDSADDMTGKNTEDTIENLDVTTDITTDTEITYSPENRLSENSSPEKPVIESSE